MRANKDTNMGTNLVQMLKKYFSKVEDFVGEKKDITGHLQLCQQMHDKIRQQEKAFQLQKPKSALLHLYIDGMDHDQIAQELAANEEELLATEGDATGSLMHQTSELMCLFETSPTDLQMVYDIPLNIPPREKKQNKQKSTSSDNENEEIDSCNESDSEGEESDELNDEGNKSSTDEGLVVNGEGESDEESHDEEMSSDNADEASENGLDEHDKEQDSDDDRGEEESQEASSEDSDADSDDSAYAELDKQLFEQYMNDSKADEDDDGDSDDPIEDLAGASESESEDENEHKNLDKDQDQEDDDEDAHEHEEAHEDEESDSEERPSKKRKKTVRFDTKSTSKSNNENPLKKVQLPNFSHSSVDSQFFNVRESEYIADEDLIGADNFKDIDFMEDIPDDDEDDNCGEKATYNDFFDDAPAPETSENLTEDTWGLKDNDSDDDESQTAPKPANDEDEPMETNTADQAKSRFELELEVENKLRKELEEQNISEKPWMLQGEVRAQDRPTNSTLSEYLEFASGAKLRPIINEELCSRVERVVLDRFRTKAFDDVERKAKLVDDPFEYKKKIVLDTEKSSKSLSKIYEEEYMKKQRRDSAQKAEEELPELKKIRLAYEELEDYLDALSNAHYTPKLRHPELKIMSNLPAMQLEETTPVVANDSDVLAPQEVSAPVRGLLKGDSEKTATDRKRERRNKKHKQHLKFARQQEDVSNKVKKATKDGKRLDVSTSAKVVKTAIKAGKVKQMDSNGPSIKSSTAFFKQLGEQHTAASSKHASKKRKRDDPR